MKLHEAIEKLLLESEMTYLNTSEIANKLNENKWYIKKDASYITLYQISRRIGKYSHLFNKEGSKVSLVNKSIKMNSIGKLRDIAKQISSDTESVEKSLILESNYKSTKDLADNLLPDNSGIYCIKIKDVKSLPKIFSQELIIRNHNILYIGVATISLRNRFWEQELRAKGHGTFFRSLGAILGFFPPKGSLKEKSNKRNYKFSKEDKNKIIEWIDQHLLVNWVEFSTDLEHLETKLIRKHLPILNIAKNPLALQELSDLRAECVRVACE